MNLALVQAAGRNDKLLVYIANPTGEELTDVFVRHELPQDGNIWAAGEDPTHCSGVLAGVLPEGECQYVSLATIPTTAVEGPATLRMRLNRDVAGETMNYHTFDVTIELVAPSP
jgi:hypothetical protein